jgi:hypothetical protein
LALWLRAFGLKHKAFGLKISFNARKGFELKAAPSFGLSPK